MRVALLADCHGNLVSLDAALTDIRRVGADQIICLGDVASGPQPRETLARLRAVGCPVVMGNADSWLLDPGPQPPGEAENLGRISEVDSWCAAQMRPEDLGYIRTFQPTIRVQLRDMLALLCVHGSPRSNMDVISSTTPEDVLEAFLDGIDATVVAGGHTHAPMLRQFRDITLINPGSVGFPYERLRPTGRICNPPWAEYAVVEWRGALQVEFRRVPVDAAAIVQSILRSGMPHAAWWAEGWMEG